MLSTNCLMWAKVTSPKCCVLSPSAMVRPTCPGEIDYVPAPQAGLGVGGQFRFYPDHAYFRTGELERRGHPAYEPAPATGTSTVSTSGRSSIISRPMVPRPAIRATSLYGGTRHTPARRQAPRGSVPAPLAAGPYPHDLGSQLRRPLQLHLRGATGHNDGGLHSELADRVRATPWAWLPLE